LNERHLAESQLVKSQLDERHLAKSSFD